LVAVTVAVHAAGLALLLRALMKSHAAPPQKAWPITWLPIRATWCLLLIDLTQVRFAG
jgi:hypothetical protein